MVKDALLSPGWPVARAVCTVSNGNTMLFCLAKHDPKTGWAHDGIL